MHLVKLKINNLRNIKSAEIHPGSKINFILGNNGAGKTTLLESIYLLARAKSFRQSKNRNLISDTESELIIYAEIERDNATQNRIGLSKRKDKTSVRKDGKKIVRLSDLANNIPLTIITPNIQRIVEEGPAHRRKLLNWGLFHVEQSYGKLAQRYKKTIDQRNSALSKNRKELPIWTKQLAVIGEELNQLQQTYLLKWNNCLNKITKHHSYEQKFKLEMVNGWKRGMSLLEALEEQTSSDMERGFTTAGPHRLDIRITVEDRLTKNYFSRGQNKILALNMMLAQAMLLKEENREAPILLVDDFQSELDSDHYNQVLELMSHINVQTFITSLDSRTCDHFTDDEVNMFHVEHGSIIEC
ncbi:MAG: DNA replication/repair protein RecF [Candidatus Thiodiazotropha sp. 6PDIVS]